MNTDDLSDLTSPLSSIPSSPLSSAPNSPILPPGWHSLTPPPSQDAGEDLPPVRKRRKIEPRVRTTQTLDLTSDTAQSEYDRQEALDLLLKALRKRRKIVVIAGAGISVSAGIPDFRSSHGLFRSLRGEHKLKTSGKALFDASVYKDDSSTSSFHDMVCNLSKMAENAKPTAFHRLLARLSKEGRLLRLYTQNVDGLETSLPPLATQIPLNHKAPWPQTIQLHGGLEKMMCQKCRHISDFQAHLFAGPIPPLCPECVAQDALRTTHAGKRSHGIGKLRPRIVLYNEQNPDEEAIGAVTTADFRTRPDAVIVVGTSMKIPTVRRIVHEMCRIVRDRREGTTIWINHDPVPPGKDLEDCWDLIVKSDCDEVARLANLKEWDDTSIDAMDENIDSDMEKVKSGQAVNHISGLLTPKKADTPVAIDTIPISIATPPLSQKGDADITPQKTLGVKKSAQPKTKISLKIKETKETSQKNLKNPASEGRPLSAILSGKENKGKGLGRPKSSLKRATLSIKPDQKATKQSKISGKISKPVSQNQLSSSSSKKQQPEPLSPRRDSNVNVLPVCTASEYSSTEATPIPQTPPPPPAPSIANEWRNAETISPKGSIPVDMAKLLN